MRKLLHVRYVLSFTASISSTLTFLKRSPHLQLTYIVMILYCPLIFTAKLLILLVYLRLFCPAKTGTTTTFWVIHALVWSNFAFYAAETFIAIFICSPRAKAWDSTIQGGHCLNSWINFTFVTTWNTCVDVVMYVLPIRVAWRLQLPMKKKAQISTVFATGLLYVLLLSLSGEFACARADLGKKRLMILRVVPVSQAPCAWSPMRSSYKIVILQSQ